MSTCAEKHANQTEMGSLYIVKFCFNLIFCKINTNDVIQKLKIFYYSPLN